MKKITLVLFSAIAFFTTGFAQQNGLQEGLALKYLVQLPTEQSPKAPVIVLLHGYGSNEKDLFELRIFFFEKLPDHRSTGAI